MPSPPPAPRLAERPPQAPYDPPSFYPLLLPPDRPVNRGARPVRVLVVDDHPAVRDAVALVVQGQPDMELAGVAGSAAEAFEALRAERPDVAVIDISLGDAHGLDLVQNLRAEDGDLAVVVFSMYDEAVYAERALRAGALGYVRKSEPTSVVAEAIRAAADGEIYLARRTASRLLARVALGAGPDGDGDGSGPDGLRELTDREMAVFQLLGQGETADDIAGRLNLSRKTVETYRRRAKEKLGLDSVTELLQFAIRWTYAQEPRG